MELYLNNVKALWKWAALKQCLTKIIHVTLFASATSPGAKTFQKHFVSVTLQKHIDVIVVHYNG